MIESCQKFTECLLPLQRLVGFESKKCGNQSLCKLTLENFCGFSMGRNQYWAGRVYDLCVYYMTGTPEGSTKSGLMEKPGIEPATPGLQGIALIHYTTGASLSSVGLECEQLTILYKR